MEAAFSGYCRNYNESRTVCIDYEVGCKAVIDCDYYSCPYVYVCPIADQITDELQNADPACSGWVR